MLGGGEGAGRQLVGARGHKTDVKSFAASEVFLPYLKELLNLMDLGYILGEHSLLLV